MRTEQENDELRDAVIKLHDVARLLEKTVGRGQLSDDIRDCANRLHTLVQYNYIKKD
jgi:hypothetical protein